MTDEEDIRELPSWKYFSWGSLNGIILGISILHKIDISETGIASMILDVFKPIYESTGLSTEWITLIGIILGLASIISLLIEAFSVWKKGWIPRIIALFGFLSFLLILLNVNGLGVILLLIGGGLVALFPDK
jgi:hypothetical protein